LEIVERNLEHLYKEAKTPENQVRIHTLEKVKNALSHGFETPALNHEESESIKDMGLFIVKPTIYALNCSDTEPVDLNTLLKLKNKDIFLFSAFLEEELEGFSEAEKLDARRDLHLAEEGPAGIVKRCFDRLNLMLFYTVKGDESRAWSIPKGTKIVDAAGKIHSDFAEGFIKAEVVAYDDLAASGNFHLAKEHGKVRVEGKNYEVKDGDVVLIKFKT